MAEQTYHHDNLKQELIEAGLHIIAEEGIEALSLRRLAALCNVSHAAPYKHFKNKQAILDAITEQVQQEFVAYLRDAVAAVPDPTPHRNIVGLGKGYVQFMLEHPDYLKFIFFTPSTNQLNSENIIPEIDCCYPLNYFRSTALIYLQSIGANPAEYEYDIIAMWSMVHGLTLILANQNWKPSIPYLDAVEKILSEKLTFVS